MIRVRGLHKTYRDETRTIEVLSGADFEAKAGEFIAIRGRSGSGKTTLINIIGGLDRDYVGEVHVQDAALSTLSDANMAHYRSATVGFVFQSFHLLRHLTVLDNVSLPAVFARGDGAGSPEEIRARATLLLEEVDLADHAQALPSQLSGGQKQRVAIARALFNRPPVLVCDEPTGNLDAVTAEEILDLFARLNTKLGTTLLVVTHDPHVAERATRQVTVLDGQIHGGHVHDTPHDASAHAGAAAPRASASEVAP